MVNYIICTGSKALAMTLKQIVTNYMMNYDVDCKYYQLNKSETTWKSTISEMRGYKVFLLDIDEEDILDLSIAKYIRIAQSDWSSIIIGLTNHKRNKTKALESRLYLLDCINKQEPLEPILREDLEKIRHNYNQRQKILTIETNRMIHRIPFNELIKIEKEKDSKKCRIETTYGEFCICNKSLGELYKSLDERFLKISRSCIVNLDQIRKYDSIKNALIFKNGLTLYDTARDHKKDVIQSLNKINN